MLELPIADIKHTVWGADVYEPSDDTFLLVDALQQDVVKWSDFQGEAPTVLELGCGSGYVSCSVALMLQHLCLHAQMLAVDHSRAAVEATCQTLQNHKVHHMIEVIQSDLTRCVHHNLVGHVDLLVFNPPYVPTPDEEMQKEGVASAWAGGHKGRRVIDRILPQLRSLMSPQGIVYMVTVSENDPAGIVRDMIAQGFQGCVYKSRQADEEFLSIVRLQRQV